MKAEKQEKVALEMQKIPKSRGGRGGLEERQVAGGVKPRWEKNSWWVF
jgi:hypothetical protein